VVLFWFCILSPFNMMFYLVRWHNNAFCGFPQHILWFAVHVWILLCMHCRKKYRKNFPTQRILAKDVLCSPHSTGNWFSSSCFCAVWKGSATMYEQMWEHSEDGSGVSMTLYLFELPLSLVCCICRCSGLYCVLIMVRGFTSWSRRPNNVWISATG
jgi:hypothetical protein